jgi:hypothetical protein
MKNLIISEINKVTIGKTKFSDSNIASYKYPYLLEL